MAEIVGTQDIENAVVAFVIDRETQAGRKPIDTRFVTSTAGDLISGDRLIEVKGYSGTSRGADLRVGTDQAQAAVSDGSFHLYIVENVGQGDPALFRLLDLHGEQLRRLMIQAVERSYVTVPWPDDEHDALSAAETAGVHGGPTSEPR
ncbi:MAG: protein NO VEIN domain-containing protein [Cellulomonas sp.]